MKTRPGSGIRALLFMTLVVSTVASADHPATPRMLPQFSIFPDATGIVATFNTDGPIDLTNPFFQSLGTNGRSCGSCHQPQDAWSIAPAHIRQRFEATNGRDPIFRTNDGANCPTANVTTMAARRDAYSLLLNKGLIRVEMAVPETAEFVVLQSENPYGCDDTRSVSVYRRPLPTASLPYLSTVMWDGRETLKGLSIFEDLGHQVVSATLGHAQAAAPPSADQIAQIVALELGLFTAQMSDRNAGWLGAGRARGGPVALAQQDFFLGINDSLGLNPTGAAFTPRIFDLFDSWAIVHGDHDRDHTAARQAIARGQQLFNSLPITIEGVAGLNDIVLPLDGQMHSSLQGTCGSCHDSPNIGNHSLVAPLNIGLTEVSRRTADLPLFTLMNKTTGELKQTSDPGRALVSGKWTDVGKFKGPILRGLAARAPYFHNGSAASLEEVMDFYDSRFLLHLTAQQKADFVAFLQSL
jgi:cytochrome c peroxidase